MHFFLEHEKLSNELIAFGPLPAHPTTRYSVSSKFSVTEQPKAFACQESMMVVTPSNDENLVNVILCPIKGLTVPFPKIKFYVYGGLLKSSFMTGGAIKPRTDPDCSDCSDFIKRLWEGHAKRKDIDASIPDPTPADIGFTNNLNTNPTIKEILNRSFTGLSSQLVKEGEWIGDFGTSCGLEIITSTDHMVIDLNYVRNALQEFISGTGSTPEQIFILRAEREVIGNYIDPAAFWGMHYDKGIHVFDPTAGTKKRKIKKEALYTAIIDKYTNRNRVYLDIRSEYGYSYNFYQNYGDSLTGNDLRFKTHKELTFTDRKYETDWPIFSSDGDNPELGNYSSYFIQLRVDDNIKPLVFIENRKNTPHPRRPPFISEEKLLDGAATDWTKDIELRFPNIEVSGSRCYVANYLRFQYFRQVDNPASPAKVHRNTNFLDGIFGDLVDTVALAGTPLNVIENNKRNLVRGEGFSYVADARIFYDAANVIFTATRGSAYKTSRKYFSLIPAIKKDKPFIQSSSFPKEVVFNKWTAENAANTESVDILELAGYNEAKKATNRENIYLLGLTRAEFETLRNLEGLSAKHNRYLKFEEIQPTFADKDNRHFKVYALKVRGFRPDGTKIDIVAPATDIIVFGAGGTIFCSKDFAEQQIHTSIGMPDPGVLSEYAHVGTNHYTGTVPLTMNDNGATPYKEKVFRNAHLFFPAKSDNVTDLGINQSNVSDGTFPLIVVIPGNGHYYTQYDDLCRHLAGNGFIVASIDCTFLTIAARVGLPVGTRHYFLLDSEKYYLDTADSRVYNLNEVFVGIFGEVVSGTINLKIFRKGMKFLGRANVLFNHLSYLETLLGTKVQLDNIGLLGHSRGGEAVLVAARDGSVPGYPLINPSPSIFKIKSVASLAPTDRGDKEKLTQDIPYFVLYGSRDGDVKGIGDLVTSLPPLATGFALWDRASNNSRKSMAFVYGATHNGFVTTNYDYPIITGPHTPISESIQKNIMGSYMNAFFRMTLRNEGFWKPLFTGEIKPKSVVFPPGKGAIYLQFQESGQPVTVDDFEVNPVWNLSTIGGVVTFSSTEPTEGALGTLDTFSPHDTRGFRVIWGANDQLTFSIPAGSSDVHTFSHISFRLAKVFEKSGVLETLKLRLKDGSGRPGDVTLSNDSLFAGFKIPDPDERSSETVLKRGKVIMEDMRTLTKSAMITIRIPLAQYQAQGVDLSNIKELSFLFPGTGKGDVLIDDIEFTN
jgi:dienelactone hydrolase